MKMIIEHGRIVVKSCSDNLTDIGYHTKIKIVFKENSIAEKTLYIISANDKVELTKWTLECDSLLYTGENLFINSMIDICCTILNELEINRKILIRT